MITLEQINENQGIDYWKARALQAEEVAQMYVKNSHLDPNELAKLIVKHVANGSALELNAYRQSLAYVAEILGQMVKSQAITVDVVNTVVTNIQLVLSRFDAPLEDPKSPTQTEHHNG